VVAVEQVLEKTAAEQREREEKERLDAEQRKRESLDAERRDKERWEAERREREERERLEAERRKREEQERPADAVSGVPISPPQLFEQPPQSTVSAESGPGGLKQTSTPHADKSDDLREQPIAQSRVAEPARLRTLTRLSYVPFALTLLSFFLPFAQFKGDKSMESGFEALLGVSYPINPIGTLCVLATLCPALVLVSSFLKFRRKMVLELIFSWLGCVLLALFLAGAIANTPVGIGFFSACIFQTIGAAGKSLAAQFYRCCQ
jgi:hypothetical protein